MRCQASDARCGQVSSHHPCCRSSDYYFSSSFFDASDPPALCPTLAAKSRLHALPLHGADTLQRVRHALLPTRAPSCRSSGMRCTTPTAPWSQPGVAVLGVSALGVLALLAVMLRD